MKKKFLMTEKVRATLKDYSTTLNAWFDSLAIKTKKAVLLAFGIVMGSISLIVMIQALNSDQEKTTITIDKITMPNNIHMHNQGIDIPEDQLIPVGKLKGEINGEFEAFYLAVDKHGQTFINRSLEFSDDAYTKSKGWELISRQELAKYEKDLHFIPTKGKGLKY